MRKTFPIILGIVLPLSIAALLVHSKKASVPEPDSKPSAAIQQPIVPTPFSASGYSFSIESGGTLDLVFPYVAYGGESVDEAEAFNTAYASNFGAVKAVSIRYAYRPDRPGKGFGPGAALLHALAGSGLGEARFLFDRGGIVLDATSLPEFSGLLGKVRLVLGTTTVSLASKNPSECENLLSSQPEQFRSFLSQHGAKPVHALCQRADIGWVTLVGTTQ